MDNMKNKAVFIDRDGVIISSKNFARSAAEIIYIPHSIDAIRILTENNYSVFIITNQGGIALGYTTIDIVENINSKIDDDIKEAGGRITQIYYCPHHEKGIIPEYKKICPNRKPATGFIKTAALYHNLDIENSFFIGDMLSDIKCGKNSGMKTILVKTGLFEKAVKDGFLYKGEKVEPDYITDDLYNAVQIIINNSV